MKITKAEPCGKMERDFFDAVPKLAALVADLLEEVARLKGRVKGRVKAAGLTAD